MSLLGFFLLAQTAGLCGLQKYFEDCLYFTSSSA